MISALLSALSRGAFSQTQQPQAAGAPPAPAAQPQNPAAAKTTPKPAPEAPTTAVRPLTLQTERDKESYALGMNIAKGMKAGSVDIDPAIMARAMKDVLSGAKPLLTDGEMAAELRNLQTEVETRRKELSEKNLKEGQAFLAANRNKEGVVALPDGLQYKILTQGRGPIPRASDAIVCQYRGTLIDGTEFDSSTKRGGNATLPVGGTMIKGWTQALEMMPVGSKWQIVMPPDLAYGERGAGQLIGPNATIIFEVELISIQPPNTPPPPNPSTPSR
jgi:FKBP-type peptidyl-prolyl cis-trans isomerase FklB